MNNTDKIEREEHIIRIPVNSTEYIEGNLTIAKHVNKLVIFAHGSGSGRHSPRNQYVAKILNNEGISALLLDLLTEKEERIDNVTAEYRFNIPLLADRLVLVTDYILHKYNQNKNNIKRIGYFGASTGAAAALIAAEKRKDEVNAVVSRGGRVDLASQFTSMENIRCPILFIVGEEDLPVIDWNRNVMENQISNVKEKKMIIVPGASHLFEEKGKLEEVARYAADWFKKYL
jgi:putative phosphoribosyl transferase